MRHSIRQRLLLVLLVVPCLGAGRTEPGTEVVGGGGIGRYTLFRICAGPDLTARDVLAYGKASHQFENGARFTIEAGHSQGHIVAVTNNKAPIGAAPTPPDPAEQVGAPVRQTSVALRGGSAWRYGGIEVGVVASINQLGWRKPDFEWKPAPSAEGWLGHPDYGYVWARALAGPPVAADGFMGRVPGICAGLGHRGDTFRFEAGIGTTGVMVEGDVTLGHGVFIGTSSHAVDANAWSTLATLGVRFGGKE